MRSTYGGQPLMRQALAVLFALLLGTRLLTPAGFMPAFDHGAVRLVACPDAAFAPPAGHHHPGERNSGHQPCPYAAAASIGGVAADRPSAFEPPLPATVDPVEASSTPAHPRVLRDRPPVRGPPIPA